MNWYKKPLYRVERGVRDSIKRDKKSRNTGWKRHYSVYVLEWTIESKPTYCFQGWNFIVQSVQSNKSFFRRYRLIYAKKANTNWEKISKDEIIRIADSIGMILVNPDNIKSRHDYNKYRFNYNSVFSDVPQEIIIETSYYQNSFPVEKHKISSFVGQFCVENRLQLSIPFEAANTEINVQSIERTFIDKVFAICDYYIQNMQDRDSRHLYGICKLLPFVKLDQNLNDLVNVVRRDRMLSKNNPSAQLQYNIPNMLQEIIQNKFYEPDYNFITKKIIVWGY